MSGVGAAMAGLAHLPAAAQQGEMFGGVPIEQRRIGRGRPPGAQNLHSAKVRAWILGRADNPLEGLVALSLPADLIQIADKARAVAGVFRCSAKDAVEIMIKCSDLSNRYLNAPPPVDVNVTDRRVVLAVGVGMAPQAGEAAGNGLDVLRQRLLANAAARNEDDLRADEQVIDAIAEVLEDNHANSST